MNLEGIASVFTKLYAQVYQGSKPINAATQLVNDMLALAGPGIVQMGEAGTARYRRQWATIKPTTVLPLVQACGASSILLPSSWRTNPYSGHAGTRKALATWLEQQPVALASIKASFHSVEFRTFLWNAVASTTAMLHLKYQGVSQACKVGVPGDHGAFTNHKGDLEYGQIWRGLLNCLQVVYLAQPAEVVTEQLLLHVVKAQKEFTAGSSSSAGLASIRGISTSTSSSSSTTTTTTTSSSSSSSAGSSSTTNKCSSRSSAADDMGTAAHASRSGASADDKGTVAGAENNSAGAELGGSNDGLAGTGAALGFAENEPVTEMGISKAGAAGLVGRLMGGGRGVIGRDNAGRGCGDVGGEGLGGYDCIPSGVASVMEGMLQQQGATVEWLFLGSCIGSSSSSSRNGGGTGSGSGGSNNNSSGSGNASGNSSTGSASNGGGGSGDGSGNSSSGGKGTSSSAGSSGKGSGGRGDHRGTGSQADCRYDTGMPAAKTLEGKKLKGKTKGRRRERAKEAAALTPTRLPAGAGAPSAAAADQPLAAATDAAVTADQLKLLLELLLLTWPCPGTQLRGAMAHHDWLLILAALLQQAPAGAKLQLLEQRGTLLLQLLYELMLDNDSGRSRHPGVDVVHAAEYGGDKALGILDDLAALCSWRGSFGNGDSKTAAALAGTSSINSGSSSTNGGSSSSITVNSGSSSSSTVKNGISSSTTVSSGSSSSTMVNSGSSSSTMVNSGSSSSSTVNSGSSSSTMVNSGSSSSTMVNSGNSSTMVNSGSSSSTVKNGISSSTTVNSGSSSSTMVNSGNSSTLVNSGSSSSSTMVNSGSSSSSSTVNSGSSSSTMVNSGNSSTMVNCGSSSSTTVNSGNSSTMVNCGSSSSSMVNSGSSTVKNGSSSSSTTTTTTTVYSDSSSSSLYTETEHVKPVRLVLLVLQSLLYEAVPISLIEGMSLQPSRLWFSRK